MKEIKKLIIIATFIRQTTIYITGIVKGDQKTGDSQ